MELLQTILPLDPEIFDKWMKRQDSVLSLVKWIAGLGCTCAGGMVAVVIWVNNTTTAIASTQQRIDVVNRRQDDLVRDWTPWRAETDRNITRMLALQEGQQKLMERLADKVDRRQ
jgi:hypothetical protein